MGSKFCVEKFLYWPQDKLVHLDIKLRIHINKKSQITILTNVTVSIS